MRHRKTMLKEERKGSLFKCITNRGYIFLTGGVSFILKGMLTCLPFCFTGYIFCKHVAKKGLYYICDMGNITKTLEVVNVLFSNDRSVQRKKSKWTKCTFSVFLVGLCIVNMQKGFIFLLLPLTIIVLNITCFVSDFASLLLPFMFRITVVIDVVLVP